MRLIYLTLLVILPSIIFAQSNYHEGYVLKNNGDTLKGYIDYREWTRSPKLIAFKINKEDKQHLKFDPSTIKGFKVNEMEAYVSYIRKISINKTDIAHMSEKLDTTQKLDSIFLRQIVTGKHLTLYYYGDEIKTHFFIAEANAVPVELRYYEYYNDYRQVISSTIYKGQLLIYANKYLPGNIRLSNRIEQAHYDQSNLELIVNKINDIDGGPRVKKKSMISLFTGIAINRSITEANNVDYTSIVKHTTTLSPKINFGVDIFDNPNVQRLIFRAEASFSYIAPRYYYPVTVSNKNVNEVYSFNQYTASITPQILINLYNKDAFKFYIGAGLSINYSVYTNDKITIPNIGTTEKPYRLEPLWSNFPLQMGVILNKRIEIHLTRIGYAAYTKYDTFSVSNQSYNLGVKFRLGKN